ncbi:MAG: SUMF1/EgtB/PvdO family nonheme iron enzyme [Candidatus Omnitrophica bacterium]|nr:SUMF1/EgtB/PvdO family nonheme iron enzyme [Candidatus Omnitrophota bacterium]
MRYRTWSFVFAFWILGLAVWTGNVYANNIAIANSEIKKHDTDSDTITIEFDISWDNSWYSGINHDAAWVFIKFTTDGGRTWGHATLLASGTNPSVYSNGTGTSLDIVVPSDCKGAFLKRSAVGEGSVDTNNIQLVWAYGTDNVGDIITTHKLQVKVMAIEMVYVPAGSFYLGDGNSTAYIPPGGFYNAGSAYSPVLCSSEGEKTLGGSTSGNLMSKSGMAAQDDFDSGTTKTLPAAFPKGYDAFYAMKYPVSQGLYVSFLNTLSRTQQQNRIASDISSDSLTNVYVMLNASAATWRQVITAPSDIGPTSERITVSCDRSGRAMNYMSWMDAAAVADWAALRPMSELEWEKLCRGTLYPVAGEYAWGNTTIAAATTISGLENNSETITSPYNANAHYNTTTLSGGDGGQGPLRVGIFAESSTTRSQAGAGYYSAFDLSGNLWSMVVNVGTATGRSFTGSHGDGRLVTDSVGTSYAGNATNTDWPGIDSTAANGVVAATGAGLRGGSWNTTSYRLQLSNRYDANTAPSSRDKEYGFRAVRDAP